METKTCGICEKEFEATTENFYKNPHRPNGLHSTCKKCKNETKRKWRKNLREYLFSIVREAKNKPCEDCGQTFPYFVMDLHHEDGEEKVEAVSQMPNKDYNEEEIREEIKKCIVLCANCHRIRTWSKSRRF